VTIISGGTLGLFASKFFSARLREITMDVLGSVTLLGAVDALRAIWNPKFVAALPTGWTTFTILFALLIGSGIGNAIRIEDRLEAFGEWLRLRFGGSEHGFINGFMTASLIFAIGPLAIMGSVSDGMGTGINQLLLKSTLDFFGAMTFASSLGIGVIASVIPVALYQFIWTGIGYFLGNIMNQYEVLAMTGAGGILLLGIALRLLGIKKMRIGDMLPALFLAPVIALIAHQFLN
jgi:uncharacterized membrane protein YqgA involved in biofilm formation